MSTRTWWAAALAATVVWVGCGGTPDTEANVRNALDEANIDSVEVYVNGEANVVHLSGTVETLADRTRAEEVAAAAVGTTGRVINELTVEALEETPDDPDDQLTSALDRLVDGDAVLRERDVNIQVDDGHVTVTGEVRSAAERDRVARLLERAPGVTRLTNQLQVHADH